ncbi:hypothetical protein A500_04616 [Clostridium sartagoforme AAU1]|uniref:Uncharacterized protein n=1 Tax=Clostridium sartagoforme AAU1 TaxID=1202534 RepID=R9CJR4_9CLOT|nr:hypothetical protein [Clostridium sartagoforme]EOR27396.1 hypothetical protein A500_04616 [Clostridium sartagoforme AAU1]
MSKAIEEALISCTVKLLKFLANGLIKGSFWICLIFCLISLLLYIGGRRKAGKGISIAIILYVLLQTLGGAFNI